MESCPEEQADELEALRAIFEDDFTEISHSPPCFMVKLTDLDVNVAASPSLKVTFTPNYPHEPPHLEMPQRSQVLTPGQLSTLVNHLYQVAVDSVGMGMVFTLVDEAKTWINENVTSDAGDEDASDKDAGQDQEDNTVLTKAALTEPKLVGGRWDFVIGLVGKPSAGKSTFFNAAVGNNQAKMAAHPFTTIEPNISKAYYTIPCPCAQMEARCDAAYGHNFEGERYVPVLLKDVAGLVPGASEGKGRGNRFLNDLLDADVLIHIIDSSGTTNENGEQAEGYDPCHDIVWLQQELHQWIYDNVMAQWDAIRRRPTKLVDMFTGYHASKAVIHSALQSAGVDTRDLSSLPTWNSDVLHRIVDQFLRIGFPIFLALNKADTPTAEENILRIQMNHPGMCLPVSAQTEVLLQSLHKDGVIDYSCGDHNFICKNPSAEQRKQLDGVQALLNRYGSTNVHCALSEAVKLRKPSYAFPVTCLDTLVAVDKYRGEAPGKLRDCVTLRPGTVVHELHTALCHYPLQLLAGDFIRAETLDEKDGKRIMRKDEVITATNCIIKIMTNRKVSQVKSRE